VLIEKGDGWRNLGLLERREAEGRGMEKLASGSTSEERRRREERIEEELVLGHDNNSFN
jgi:hypothetical protein